MTTTTLFTLTQKATKEGETLRLHTKGHGQGKQWHKAGPAFVHSGTNTRTLTIVSLQDALPATFTKEQALAHMEAHRAALLPMSATPASRFNAFLKAGYIAEATEATEEPEGDLATELVELVEALEAPVKRKGGRKPRGQQAA
jgi:penicillin V acylase-like amidase (Ntn superfamily)